MEQKWYQELQMQMSGFMVTKVPYLTFLQSCWMGPY